MLQKCKFLTPRTLAPSVVTDSTHWKHIGDLASSCRKIVVPRCRNILDHQNAFKLFTALEAIWKQIGEILNQLITLTACWNVKKSAKNNLSRIIPSSLQYTWYNKRHVGMKYVHLYWAHDVARGRLCSCLYLHFPPKKSAKKSSSLTVNFNTTFPLEF